MFFNTMGFLWGVVGFLITIGLLVTIHEYGHFWMARRFGVKIIRFSLGFGKPLLTWTGKKEGTKYTLSPIPLGGFVQMYGEKDDDDIAEADRDKTFHGKAPWQRFLIAFAGPAVNLIFAVLAFALLFFTGVQGMQPQVAMDGQENDLIRIGRYVAAHPHENVAFTVSRNGQLLDITGQIGERENRAGKMAGYLGVQWQLADLSAYATVERYGVLESLYRGAAKTGHYVQLTFAMFGRMIKGEVSLDNLGGPITIGDAAGKTLQFGWDVFLNFLGVVSLSLAALNLLPVPMLDGGHMLFYAVETVRGKPLSERAMTWAYRIGQTLLFAFIAFVLLNDVYRYVIK